jgi:hypothetical protein
MTKRPPAIAPAVIALNAAITIIRIEDRLDGGAKPQGSDEACRIPFLS